PGGGAFRTKTREMLVLFGSRYSTNCPLLGSSRSTRSVLIEPVQTSPFLSTVTSYGADHGVGASHSVNWPVLVSSTPIRLPRNSPNQRRSAASIIPRRGAEFAVGVVKS